MTRPPRVAEDLNRALHDVLERDECAYLLGEDIADPYGGAFKVAAGLSTRFPGQVLSTPISEAGIVGAGAGLALMGNTAIVEMMFADFATLALDQLVNFAAKSVAMYGRRVPVRLIVRCPTGGNRGYGPTHSQSLQKLFLGFPGLSVYEASPVHGNAQVFSSMLDRAEPCVLFEDKVLYTRPMAADGWLDDLLRFDFLDGGTDPVARVFAIGDARPDWVFIAPGGLTGRVTGAMRSLLLEEEITAELLIPSRLYPFDIEPLLPRLDVARRVCVVEDGTAGGSWAETVAHAVQARLWGRLSEPVRVVQSLQQPIPTARHLEQRVIVQQDTIRDAVLEGWR